MDIGLSEIIRRIGQTLESNHAETMRQKRRELSKGTSAKETIERKGYDRLWLWFELSRAGWVTIPRVLLHEMPDEWQNKMAALLEEYQQTFTNWPEGISTKVQITDHGKFTCLYNWMNNYRYPAKEKIAKLRSK